MLDIAQRRRCRNSIATCGTVCICVCVYVANANRAHDARLRECVTHTNALPIRTHYPPRVLCDMITNVMQTDTNTLHQLIHAAPDKIVCVHVAVCSGGHVVISNEFELSNTTTTINTDTKTRTPSSPAFAVTGVRTLICMIHMLYWQQ